MINSNNFLERRYCMVKKFVSSSSLSKEEIKSVLLRKINEESSKIADLKENSKVKKDVKPVANKINIVSLFSGAGGLDLGTELSGIDVIMGNNYTNKILRDKKDYEKNRNKGLFNFIYSNDIFPEANKTYANNFAKSVVQDDRDIREILKFPKCQLIIGGFPCPGFSSAGPRLIDDPRNFLYIHFIRALIQNQPEFFIAENVKGMTTLANGEVFKQVVEDFSSAGYDVQAHLVNSKDYGVAQSRERIILIGTNVKKIKERYDWEYELPKPTNGKEVPYLTLKDVIGDLPSEPDDVFEGDFSSMYMSRNRKKKWDDQSFTIQASGRQAPLWPGGDPMKKIGKDRWEFNGKQNRRLSVKEVARIQGFPDWFQFNDGDNKAVKKNNRLNKQYKQIGNAVPVMLARNIMKPLAEFLNSHPELQQK